MDVAGVRGRVGRRAVGLQLRHHRGQLVVDVAPFTQPLVGQEVTLAPTPHPAGGLLRRQGLLVGAPDVQQGEKIRGAVHEGRVGLVGGGALVRRPLAHVVDAQGGGDHRHLRPAASLPGLDEHPRQTRVQGEARHAPAHGGEAQPAATEAGVGGPGGVGRRHCPQFLQQGDAVADALVRRPVDEGKIGDVAQVEGDHAQYGFGQVGAQDFRGGEAGAALVVSLAVEPETDPVGHPAAAAGTLVATGPADGHHRQGRGTGARAVAGDAGQAAVHHVADAGDSQGGFGHVGGHHDLAPGRRREDAHLVGGREAGEQGQDHRAPVAARCEQFDGVADVLLGGHEDEHVPERSPALDFVHRGHGGLHVGGGVFIAALIQGTVVDPHRVHAAGNLDHRGVVKGRGEFFRVDGGRGDDKLQVPPAAQHSAQQAENEIDVEAPLVGFIHDESVVGEQVPVPLGLGQQDSVGHDLDQGPVPGFLVEADLVAHRLARRLAQLLGDAARHGEGGDAPRLGAADHSIEAAACFQAELGQLGGLARAGFAGHDHHRMTADGIHDGLPVGADGQGRVIGQRWHQGAALLLAVRRMAQLLGDDPQPPLGHRLSGGGPAAQPGQFAAGAGTLDGHGRRQPPAQGVDGSERHGAVFYRIIRQKARRAGGRESGIFLTGRSGGAHIAGSSCLARAKKPEATTEAAAPVEMARLLRSLRPRVKRRVEKTAPS